MLGFLGGAAKGAHNELDDQDKRAFALKLQNAQIEGQLASQKEMADYNSASEAATTDMSGGVEKGRANAATQNWWMAKEKATRAVEAAKARAANQNKPRIYMREGKVMERTWSTDPDTGERIASEIQLGVSPGAYTKYAEFSAEAESMYALLDSMEEGAKKLLTDKNYARRLFGAAEITLENMTGSGDKSVVDLAARLESNALAIAATINRGRPTDPDRMAVQRALPKKSDSLTVALEKINSLREISKRTQKNMYSMLIDGRMEPPGSKAKPGAPKKSFADWKKEQEELKKPRP